MPIDGAHAPHTTESHSPHHHKVTAGSHHAHPSHKRMVRHLVLVSTFIVLVLWAINIKMHVTKTLSQTPPTDTPAAITKQVEHIRERADALVDGFRTFPALQNIATASSTTPTPTTTEASVESILKSFISN